MSYNTPVNGQTGGSLSSNPTVALVDLTQHGSDWLWAVFAVMLVTGTGILGWGHILPSGRRAFHYMAAVVLFTASIAYFSMASDLGSTPIVVEFVRNTGVTYTGNESPVTRSIWYARYIDWTITTPMLLLTLLMGTGMPLGEIMFTVFMDLVMIITGLIGALVFSQYKWGFFVFGCFAMFYVFWQLIVPARKYAYALSPEAGKAYTTSSFVLATLWFVYPIIWGVADGGNVISTDSEMVAYGVLDVLAKPGFTLFHLMALSRVPYESFQLNSGHFSAGAIEAGAAGAGAAATGAAYEEKKHGHHNGVGNGVGNGVANGHHNGMAEPTNAPVAPTTGATGTTGHIGEGHHPNAATMHSENPGAFHQTQPAGGVVSQSTV